MLPPIGFGPLDVRSRPCWFIGGDTLHAASIRGRRLQILPPSLYSPIEHFTASFLPLQPTEEDCR